MDRPWGLHRKGGALPNHFGITNISLRSEVSQLLAQEPPSQRRPSPAQGCSGLRCEGGHGLLRQQVWWCGEAPGWEAKPPQEVTWPRFERGDVWGASHFCPYHYLAVVCPC